MSAELFQFQYKEVMLYEFMKSCHDMLMWSNIIHAHSSYRYIYWPEVHWTLGVLNALARKVCVINLANNKYSSDHLKTSLYSLLCCLHFNVCLHCFYYFCSLGHVGWSTYLHKSSVFCEECSLLCMVLPGSLFVSQRASSIWNHQMCIKLSSPFLRRTCKNNAQQARHADCTRRCTSWIVADDYDRGSDQVRFKSTEPEYDVVSFTFNHRHLVSIAVAYDVGFSSPSNCFCAKRAAHGSTGV